MKNRTIRFLTGSLIGISVICIVIFAFLASRVNSKNAQTVGKIGTIYMAGMSERITLHFDTTVRIRFEHLQEIVNSVPGPEPEYESLAYMAQARSFESLGLCAEDGTLEMLLGERTELVDTADFVKAIGHDEKRVVLATTESGKEMVLFGIPARYTMKNGEESIALVAGLNADFVKQLLNLEGEDDVVFSHIIRKDGRFVIRSGDAVRENYFDRIKDVFNEKKGKNADVYIEELEHAMETGEEYSTVLYIGDERRHLYCTDLPYGNWFLITVMPYGVLDEAVSGFSSQLSIMFLIGCGIILATLILVFIFYFDMTKHQLNDLELARQEAVSATRAKSEFLSNMSHDIRTPMNAIVGMTAIATANIDDKQQVQNSLRKITLSSKHLLGLINDILDMSKIENGKLTLNMEQISLREIMDSIVGIVQPQVKAKNQNFDVFLDDIDTEDVYCDSVRLNQVILNFLSNAIKFTPVGGSIHVTLKEEESPLGDNYVRVHIRVKDNGIGMSQEFKERIFDSFVREDSKRVHKIEGSGLGMAIAKYIVDAMHGTIEVESEQGVGSEFHVTLDLEKALVREEEMILPDWQMLVVDDDEMMCKGAVTALEDIGINAEWTLDGESALKMVCERHDRHEDYHIILLDWKLPGMDGIATAREIRKRVGEDTPILLISAYDWSEIEAEAREAGITGFISKPLFKSTLFYGLKKYAEPGEEQPRQTQGSKIDFSGKKVLVAEDNDLNWEIAEVLLSDIGLSLAHAENGQKCVEIFEQSPVNTFDAILMDIRMPVMTGYEAAQAIRALDRPDADIPIIAMTADVFAEDIRKCLECGMNAHVAKPIDIQEVSKQLKKFIRE